MVVIGVTVGDREGALMSEEGLAEGAPELATGAKVVGAPELTTGAKVVLGALNFQHS